MTVQAVLDALASGEITVEQAADIFRRRKWKPKKDATPAEMWGVKDDDAPDDNSWSTVETDPRITADQYAILAQAYSSTF